MSDVIDLLFNLEFVITALAGLGTFLTVVALGMPMVEKDALSSRLKAVKARRDELARQQKERLQRGSRLQPKKHVDLMRSVLDHLRLQNLIAPKHLRVRLAQAGWRHHSALISFGFARLMVPLVAMVLAGLVMVFSQKVTFGTPIKLLVVAGSGIVGYYLPMVMLTNAVQRRQHILAQAFPDALDLLSICCEAGLAVEAAFNRVSDEIGDRSPEIAEEFGLTTAELAFLSDRRMAFENLAERTGLPGTRALATALIQAEKYGTPVTVSLRVLAQENRDDRMAAAEKLAGALPAKLTVPMITFFLPVLFVVILGPPIINAMKSMR